MACRLPRYLPIMRLSPSQEALHGLDGVGERAAFGVGERRLPHPAHPVGGIRPPLEPARNRHQLGKPAFACVMRVGIALDQAARLQEFDTERDIAARRRSSLIEPCLEMRLLTPMAQRAAPKSLPTRQNVEQHKPANRPRPDPPAAIDQTPKGRNEARARLYPQTEPGRQRAAHFLASRMD